MRLFIAIPLPEEVKNRLVSVQEPSYSVRWVPDNQLHLTLKYAGELSPEQTEMLTDNLKKIPMEPLNLRLTGPGKFPESGNPRVLWAGVSSPDGLLNLRTQVSWTAVEAGAERGRHEYKPHITLGRVKKTIRKEVDDLIHPSKQITNIPFIADRFILYESILKNDGATHREMMSYPV